MDCSLQASPSMGFSRQMYRSGLPFTSPGVSSQPRDRTPVSHVTVRCFILWAHYKPCAHKETPQRPSQTCIWVSSAEVWISSGLTQGQGLWVQQTWVWHKPSWRRLPLTAPLSCQNLHGTGETGIRREKNKTMCVTGARRKEQWPHKRLTQICLWVSRSLQQKLGSAAACCRVGGPECSSARTGRFEGGCHYLHYLHHSLLSVQTKGREHNPSHQEKIGLKIYWAWPHPSGQDPVSPTVILSHQDGSISLLSLCLRGQREWKSTDHKDHSLV